MCANKFGARGGVTSCRLVIFVPKIIKVGDEVLTKTILLVFFCDTVYVLYCISP